MYAKLEVEHMAHEVNVGLIKVTPKWNKNKIL